jgi:hypothetical protein
MGIKQNLMACPNLQKKWELSFKKIADDVFALKREEAENVNDVKTFI